MDSINFHTFAERLGIDILQVENKTAAIIMDHENESTYMLDEPINMNSLARFIYSFHHNALGRFLRTNSVQFKHTHFFNIDEFLNINSKQKKKENDENKSRNKRRVCGEKSRSSNHIVIREINSEDFDSNVVNSNKVGASLKIY
jgi:hypothetical protein